MITETFRNTRENSRAFVVVPVVRGEDIVVDIKFLEFV